MFWRWISKQGLRSPAETLQAEIVSKKNQMYSFDFIKLGRTTRCRLATEIKAWSRCLCTHHIVFLWGQVSWQRCRSGPALTPLQVPLHGGTWVETRGGLSSLPATRNKGSRCCRRPWKGESLDFSGFRFPWLVLHYGVEIWGLWVACPSLEVNMHVVKLINSGLMSAQQIHSAKPSILSGERK